MTQKRKPEQINTELDRAIARIRKLESGGAINTQPGPAMGAFLALPELRGFWPFSSVNESGNALDLSGQARTLPEIGTATRGITDNGMPYVNTSPSGYFDRPSETGLEITGALTLAGWYNFNAVAANTFNSIAGKMGSSTSRSFGLSAFDASNQIIAGVSSSGTADTASARMPFYSPGVWVFLALRFTPSEEIALFVNRDKATNTTGTPPAALYNTTGDFSVGRHSGSAAANGRVSMWALCAAAVPDKVLNNLYEISRGLFGV